MLQQMAEFDVRAAKCTVAADRQAVQQQVQELFRSEHPWSTREGPDSVDEGELCTEVKLQTLALEFCDPLDRFNTYIRGTLRESVIAQIGNELEVPWQMCLAAFLPMIFYSSVNILGCDNGPCLESARLSGYSSVAQYMVVQAVGWALCIVMAFPLTYPILLRMVKLVLSHGDGPVHQVLACTCCPLAFEYSYVCGGLIWAALVSLVESYSATQLIVFLVIMAVLAAQVLCLFCGNSHHKQASCRCVRRQAAAS
ncbi:HCc2 [Symbiodinium natans]|uniref:HCc2 protein n=1 Tax=Symbiodinium natans TaxID=878477 RepID=A0A812I4N9_9DINO|nr:HCc2 [Symbiodinium natans]